VSPIAVMPELIVDQRLAARSWPEPEQLIDAGRSVSAEIWWSGGLACPCVSEYERRWWMGCAGSLVDEMGQHRQLEKG
jgi:hypothetical protein